MRRFLTARSAVAAVEFAIILPALIVFMLGGSEVARFIYISRQMTNLANSMATLVAERTTGFDDSDWTFTYGSAPVSTPFLLGDAVSRGTTWDKDVALTVSSVIFTPSQAGCTSNCTYAGAVDWSANSPIAGRRSCVTPPASAADTAPPSLTTLPTDAFSAGSVIVADVVYNYTPIFGTTLVPPIEIRRSFYLQPRYLPSIPYVGATSNDSVVAVCPASGSGSGSGGSGSGGSGSGGSGSGGSGSGGGGPGGGGKGGGGKGGH